MISWILISKHKIILANLLSRRAFLVLSRRCNFRGLLDKSWERLAWCPSLPPEPPTSCLEGSLNNRQVIFQPLPPEDFWTYLNFQLNFIPQKAFAPSSEQAIYPFISQETKCQMGEVKLPFDLAEEIFCLAHHMMNVKKGGIMVGLLKNYIRSRHPNIPQTIRRTQWKSLISQPSFQTSDEWVDLSGRESSFLSVVRSIPCQPGKPCNHRNWTDGPWQRRLLAQYSACRLWRLQLLWKNKPIG